MKSGKEKKKNSLVGKLLAKDEDINDTHSFSLIDGEGSTHNQLFKIKNNELRTAAIIDGESTPIASIRLRATDNEGLFHDQTLSVVVADAPDPPTDLFLSGNSLNMFERTGTEIGQLSVTDPDANDSHTFSLQENSRGTSNDLFFIDGTTLVSNHVFNETSDTSQLIRITAIDSAGLTKTKDFFVEITTAEKPDGFLVNVDKEPPEGGLVAGAGYYRDGESVTLKTTSNSGFSFSGHIGDVPGGFTADNPLTLTVDGDKNITTSFTEGYHKVDVNVIPDRHGYAWGGGMIQHGTEITINAKELEEKHGCVFTHWSINGIPLEVDESNPMVLKLTVDRTLRILAHFSYGLPESMKLVSLGTYSQGDARYHGEKPVITPMISAFYIDEHETTKKDFYDVYNWSIQQETPYSFMFDPNVVYGRNRAHNDPSYQDDYPITALTWLDAIAFANALSEKEKLTPVYYEDSSRTKVFRGYNREKDTDTSDEESHLGHNIYESNVDWRAKGYRLPTESEWEKAGRGGVTGLTYANSNTLDSKFAYYNQGTIIRSLSPVGSLRAQWIWFV